MKRIIYNGVIGEVLTEGRACYFVRFPWGCRFIDKLDAKETWPSRETHQAQKLSLVVNRLNA